MVCLMPVSGSCKVWLLRSWEGMELSWSGRGLSSMETRIHSQRMARSPFNQRQASLFFDMFDSGVAANFSGYDRESSICCPFLHVAIRSRAANNGPVDPGCDCHSLECSISFCSS